VGKKSKILICQALFNVISDQGCRKHLIDAASVLEGQFARGAIKMRHKVKEKTYSFMKELSD